MRLAADSPTNLSNSNGGKRASGKLSWETGVDMAVQASIPVIWGVVHADGSAVLATRPGLWDPIKSTPQSLPPRHKVTSPGRLHSRLTDRRRPGSQIGNSRLGRMR